MKYKEYKRKLKQEYQDTLSGKRSKPRFFLSFKLRYAFIAILVVIVLGLLIEHITISVYNSSIEQHNLSLREESLDLNTSKPLSQIQSKEEYNKILKNYQTLRMPQSKKVSILSNIFTLQMFGCASKSMVPEDNLPAPGDSNRPSDSFQTNVQVNGIDEADVAKSDGNYIYYLYNNNLYIYDTNKKEPLIQQPDKGEELYIDDNLIITIAKSEVTLYEWDHQQLSIKKKINYASYLNSRLTDTYLFLVVEDQVLDDFMQYKNCYYDTYSNPVKLYTIYRIHLKTMETKSIQLLSSLQTKLYASYQHFYFASYDNCHTTISIFSYELEPLGYLCVRGTVLNQFSMDEYETYFRVVSTDVYRNNEELNAITIFDLTTLKKIGYLDKGIGKDRQTVKSVRFEQKRCYIVTYENKDPLYEIDCSNPLEPVIASFYEAPGYSNYLHYFKIKDKEYVLGLGYTDTQMSTKISVYEKLDTLKQIGSDFLLSMGSFEHVDYVNPLIFKTMFSNHKALFFYIDEDYLYFGAQVAFDAYLIFKIDVASDEVISIYKEIKLEYKSNYIGMRAFLIEGKLYITDHETIIVEEFN